MDSNNYNNVLVTPAAFLPSSSPLGPIMVQLPPSPSPEWMAMPTLQQQPTSLPQLLGDWVTLKDSNSTRHKYVNDATPVKRIFFEDGIYHVLFSELAGPDQTYQLQISSDGRPQLFSSSNPDYSFFLVQGSPDLLSWQNEFNQRHMVTWQRVGTSFLTRDFLRRDSLTPKQSPRRDSRRSMSSHRSVSPMILTRAPDSIPMQNPHLSSTRFSSGILSPPMPGNISSNELPQSCFFDFENAAPLSLANTRSRPCSPSVSRQASPSPCRGFVELDDLPKVVDSRTQPPLESPVLSPRNSKQNLVDRVEPEVDDLLSHKYATKADFRTNKSGRYGPPVLRGPDVLFIPAKKQLALENVLQLIKLVIDTCDVVAASKVCQKKKRRQKKGFLVYLQLGSEEQVQNFLRVHYPHFEKTVGGVKTAVFSHQDKLAMSSKSFSSCSMSPSSTPNSRNVGQTSA